MTDLDLEPIDTAFAEFVATAAPRVLAPGADAVVTTHRHRRRMRAVGAGAAALALVASSAGYAAWHGHHTTAGPNPVSSPTPTPSVPYFEQPPDLPTADCTSSTLPMPASGLAGFERFDIIDQVVADPTGRYVVVNFIGNNDDARVVRWHDGVPELLPIPFTYPTIVGVTSDGTVVGGGTDRVEQPGWVYRDGKLTLLASYGDEIASPLAVNGAGDIVGLLYGGYTVTTPALWPAGHPDVVRPFDDVPNGEAGGIDAAGDVVGMGGPQSYVWDADGTRWSVPIPAPYEGGGGGAIAGDWVAGSVLGRPAGSDLMPYAAIWNRASGSIIVLPYAYTSFNRVTPDGTATGWFVWSGGERAVRYSDGVLALLPHVQIPGDPSSSEMASAITTDGHTIFGEADNKYVAVWHC